MGYDSGSVDTWFVLLFSQSQHNLMDVEAKETKWRVGGLGEVAGLAFY